jgi:hypothetical protein
MVIKSWMTLRNFYQLLLTETSSTSEYSLHDAKASPQIPRLNQLSFKAYTLDALAYATSSCGISP